MALCAVRVNLAQRITDYVAINIHPAVKPGRITRCPPSNQRVVVAVEAVGKAGGSVGIVAVLALVLERLRRGSVEDGGEAVLGGQLPYRLAVSVVEDGVGGRALEGVDACRAVDSFDATAVRIEEHRSRGVAVAGPVELHHQSGWAVNIKQSVIDGLQVRLT